MRRLVVTRRVVLVPTRRKEADGIARDRYVPWYVCVFIEHIELQVELSLKVKR